MKRQRPNLLRERRDRVDLQHEGMQVRIHHEIEPHQLENRPLPWPSGVSPACTDSTQGATQPSHRKSPRRGPGPGRGHKRACGRRSCSACARMLGWPAVIVSPATATHGMAHANIEDQSMCVSRLTCARTDGCLDPAPHALERRVRTRVIAHAVLQVADPAHLAAPARMHVRHEHEHVLNSMSSASWPGVGTANHACRDVS